jgi:hypothetical protein
MRIPYVVELVVNPAEKLSIPNGLLEHFHGDVHATPDVDLVENLAILE